MPGVPVKLEALVEQAESEEAKELALKMIHNCQHLGWIEFSTMGEAPPSSLTHVGLARWRGIEQESRTVDTGWDGALVTRRTFEQPYIVMSASTTPSQGLYQGMFPLGEADFIRLRQESPVLSSMAAVAFGVMLADVLKQIGPLLQEGAAISTINMWLPGIAGVIGLGLWLLSRVISSEKRQVIRKIDRHFKHKSDMVQFSRQPQLSF